MIYSTQKEKEKIIKKRKNYKTKSVNCSNPFYISLNWKAI